MKKYVKPTTEIICTHCEYGMMKEIYTMAVDENGEPPTEAGAKQHIFEELAEDENCGKKWTP